MARAYQLRGIFGPGGWIKEYNSATVHAERVDLSAPLRDIDAGGRETALIDLFDGEWSLGLVALPVVDTVPPSVLAEVIKRAAPYWPNRKSLVKGTPLTRLPDLTLRTVGAVAGSRGWGLKAGNAASVLSPPILKHRARNAVLRAFGKMVAARARGIGESEAWDAAMTALDIEAATAVEAIPKLQEDAKSEREWREGVAVNSPAYWDQVFETENPWAYDSPYEQKKYEQTLSLIPKDKPFRAIELACAEGHFTVQFADLVKTLAATDISVLALERARKRCNEAGHANIRFEQLDFFNNPIPGMFELIVCSEVLYEAKSRKALKKIAKNIATHLTPGGALVTAHIIEVTEERNRSGFDWGGVFGSKSITEALLATGELQLEEEIETELYRVQRFRRSAEPMETIHHRGEIGAAPERDYAYHVVWGGAKATWAEVEHERALAVPILMYHRIAARDDGPAGLAQYRVSPEAFQAQLRWLRSNGYHGITPAEWLDAVRNQRAIPGRPFMLTFDDGYRDFATTAWPILGNFGIPATVAIVTDHIGGEADWDRQYGTPAPLMSWAEVSRVASEGAVIASHSGSHRAMTALDGCDLLREAKRSRAAIERATGTAADSVVYPYGIHDPVVLEAFALAGYDMGFGTRPGAATLADNPFDLPRIDVNGFDDLDTFIRSVTQTDLRTGKLRWASAT